MRLCVQLADSVFEMEPSTITDRDEFFRQDLVHRCVLLPRRAKQPFILAREHYG